MIKTNRHLRKNDLMTMLTVFQKSRSKETIVFVYCTNFPRHGLWLPIPSHYTRTVRLT